MPTTVLAALTRRTSLTRLAAAGMALLGAAGSVQAAPRPARTPRCPCPTPGVTRRVVSEPSPALPVELETTGAAAECGGPGAVLSCGYQLGGTATQFVNVAVTVVGPTADAAACVVHIARIAEAGSVAGAVVRATALCRT
jgi:hypothetical protein